MKPLWKNKVAIGLTALALSCSVVLGAPAEATSRAALQNTSTSTTEVLQITQWGAGSYFATLEWPIVPGATQYLIYKTGSIRPKWRLFYITPSTVNSKTVSDKPGAIAIYRLAALVNSKEVPIGRVTYLPTR